MLFYTQYRVLKTSWGIAIDMEGVLEEISADKNTITISEKILIQNEKEQIETGLQSVFSEIANKDKKYTIEIQKVQFNYSDFQLDGLYWASRDWLSKALKTKISEPIVSYDKIFNKYLF
jgi:hypothetical protein